MSDWVDRNISEPVPGARILVWNEKGKNHMGEGTITATYDYEAWLDVADGNEVDFKYWMEVPGSPYA